MQLLQNADSCTFFRQESNPPTLHCHKKGKYNNLFVVFQCLRSKLTLSRYSSFKHYLLYLEFIVICIKERLCSTCGNFTRWPPTQILISTRHSYNTLTPSLTVAQWSRLFFGFIYKFQYILPLEQYRRGHPTVNEYTDIHTDLVLVEIKKNTVVCFRNGTKH